MAVIATLALNAIDTEHTIETLLTVSKLTGNECIFEEDGEQKHSKEDTSPHHPNFETAPKKWNHRDLITWLAENDYIDSTCKSVPKHIDGKALMRMSKTQIRSNIYDDNNNIKAGRSKANDEKADILFEAICHETDCIALVDRERHRATSQTG